MSHNRPHTTSLSSLPSSHNSLFLSQHSSIRGHKLQQHFSQPPYNHPHFTTLYNAPLQHPKTLPQHPKTLPQPPFLQSLKHPHNTLHSTPTTLQTAPQQPSQHPNNLPNTPTQLEIRREYEVPTEKFKMNRVLVWVDEHDIVVKTPHLG